MDENSGDSSRISGFALSGDPVTLLESEKTGENRTEHGTDAATRTLKKSAQISKQGYIALISEPFTIISTLRKKDYWKLTKPEKEQIGESYTCVGRHLPDFFIKWFCLIGFVITMITILLTRLSLEKEDREEETENEEQEEPVENSSALKPNTDKPKLPRGRPNEG